MNALVADTQKWLEFHETPKGKFSPSVFASTDIQNPAHAIASANYINAANSAAVESMAAGGADSTGPKNMFEGLQTIANLARSAANFNPLNPTGNGSKAHFIAFTDNMATCPVITLKSANTSNVKQNSRNSNQLIETFVAGFNGLENDDKAAVKNAVQNLVQAALSYSGQTEETSNFTQNLLATSDSSVLFHLYSSTFQISQTDHKGTITFHAEYSLNQATYELTKDGWESVQPLFAKKESVATSSWLDSMSTKKDPNSSVKLLCFG